jgi:small-conductance mechanosensitive channel
MIRPHRATRRHLALVTGLLALLGLAGPRAARAAQNGLLPALQAPAPAQEADGAAEEAPGGGEPALPPVSELVPRVVALADQAEEARAEVRDVAALEAPRAHAAALAERERSLARRLDEVLAHEYVSDDRVAALVGEAGYLAARLSAAAEEASGRVARLDAVRQDWQGRRDLWRRWQDRIAADPEYREAYSDEVARALERVSGVLEAAGAAVPEVAGLQQSLRETETHTRRLRERAEGFLRSWREDLFARTAPVLFSADHLRGLRAETRQRIGAGLAQTWEGEWRVEPFQVWVLLFQVAIALLVGWAARRLRPRVADDARWSAVLGHPWAIGVLTAAAGASFLYGPLPPLGRLALEAAVAGAASLVASRMYRNPVKRAAVYAVSALYVLFSALDAFAFPVSLLRVILTGLALAGALGVLLAGRRIAGSAWAHQRGFRWVLRLGAVALAVIGTAEILGYHFLGQWLLEASVATAFVAFVVSFLLRLARGALHLAMRADESGRMRFLARLGSAVADRLLFLVKLTLVGAAVLYVLSIWDLAESPVQAWRTVVDAGFSVGEREITVGRILAAILAVYLAFVVSWALRALLSQTFFERRQFERGIRDSISTLLHYAVVVVGGFVALSVFGFDLTSFALIAGALGVGIGFGLQNVVNNFVSGLILLFERPIRVGDVVVLGEDWGTVRKIGLRSTVIVTFNGAEMIVPNGELIASKVTNWTLSTPRARLVLPVGAAYGSDPARVIAVLEEVGRAYPLALGEPPPMAIFTGFGDSSLDFELRVWLGAFEQLLQAKSELASAIVQRFASEGISIPFPQRDLHLKSVDPGAGGRLGGGSG